jgi:hypothetical protein
MTLNAFQLGKLKIAAHVREELELLGIEADAIQCRSGDMQAHDTARLTITVKGTTGHLDLKAHEVEDCNFIVAGETWHKINALIVQLNPRT